MLKNKLVVLKGLPASGKSTYAKELVAKGYKRVNKDDLRAMIDGGKWSRQNEEIIFETEFNIVKAYLQFHKLNVVVDDTNFAHEEKWKTLAETYDAEFELVFFDVPLMECIERDSKRGEKSVGSKAIYRMYEKYLKPKPTKWSDDKQNCYIFDIDGTLAKATGRNPYDYSLVHTDTPNHNITMIARILKNSGLPIIILSGRTDDCKKETEEWLKNNSVSYDELFMRKSGDTRKDSIIKKEIYDNEIKNKYNVLAVFDDRDQVVQMWREIGLTCLQVDWGFF